MRHRTLIAVLLAGTFLVGATGTASAETGSNRPASFCGTFKRLQQEFESFSGTDFDQELIEDSYKATKRIAKQAPNSLKPAFKTLITYYDKIADADFDVTDPDLIEELATGGQKVARATTKITKYLQNKCNVELDLGS